MRQMRPAVVLLVQLVLLDLPPQIRARRDELRVLDDAGVHVHEVQRAVGPVDDVAPAGTADRSSG